MAKEIVNIRNGILDQLKQRVASAGQAHDELVNGFTTARWVFPSAGAFQIIVLVAAAVLVGRSLATGIKRLTATMTGLARGSDADLRLPIPGVDRVDEVGDMARMVETFKQNAIRVRALEAEQAENIKRSEAERKADLARIANEFKDSVSGIVNTVATAANEMLAASGNLRHSANQTSKQAETVSVATAETSANVQTVAAATEEMSASISEIGRQVEVSASIARGAVGQANNTRVTVSGLAEAANKIGNVIRLIQDIAGQTNLLALNATIEAARAGEAGKGFAVVASEVKMLASQTAQASEEIAAQVNSIQISTANTVDAIDDISGVIQKLDEISTAIASAVQEQSAATSNISDSVSHASHGTAEIASNILNVTEAATQTAAASEQIGAYSANLSKQGDELRKQVDYFLGALQTG
ncbi:methyl-accepting chemotaxis protein [Pleomorphomonas sp. PLEO]|uniref:methyl-accepting chemotaxis protein n=1 Tax=Pleomorphomonas sp. PLEO TaxID=3239306 RepID=UPI00351E04BB